MELTTTLSYSVIAADSRAMNVSSIHMFGGILRWALQLGINCCVLMRANIANEILQMHIEVEKFSEATVGYRENKEIAEKWVRLFSTPYFMVLTGEEIGNICADACSEWREKSFDELEAEMLQGQKLQDTAPSPPIVQGHKLVAIEHLAVSLEDTRGASS
ncbi:hypothetical protein C3L33_23137, partial [Rhododendron williamsianum]